MHAGSWERHALFAGHDTSSFCSEIDLEQGEGIRMTRSFVACRGYNLVSCSLRLLSKLFRSLLSLPYLCRLKKQGLLRSMLELELVREDCSLLAVVLQFFLEFFPGLVKQEH